VCNAHPPHSPDSVLALLKIDNSTHGSLEDAAPSSYRRTAKHEMRKQMQTNFEKGLQLRGNSSPSDPAQYMLMSMNIAFEVVASQLARIQEEVKDLRVQSG
jgi:hypothetical protein